MPQWIGLAGPGRQECCASVHAAGLFLAADAGWCTWQWHAAGEVMHLEPGRCRVIIPTTSSFSHTQEKASSLSLFHHHTLSPHLFLSLDSRWPADTPLSSLRRNRHHFGGEESQHSVLTAGRGARALNRAGPSGSLAASHRTDNPGAPQSSSVGCHERDTSRSRRARVACASSEV